MDCLVSPSIEEYPFDQEAINPCFVSLSGVVEATLPVLSDECPRLIGNCCNAFISLTHRPDYQNKKITFLTSYAANVPAPFP